MDYETIELNDMVEPLERMFEREFPVDPLITAATETDARFVTVEPSSRSVHAVRMEDNYADCIFDLSAGIHVARDLPANHRWIALPLDAFRDGEEEFNDVMMSQCRSRGVGIITVQQKGKGLSAKVILDATVQSGDFVEDYPVLVKELEKLPAAEVAVTGFRVVSHD